MHKSLHYRMITSDYYEFNHASHAKHSPHPTTIFETKSHLSNSRLVRALLRVELCYGRVHCSRFPRDPLLFRPGMLPFVTTETFIWWSWMATMLYEKMQLAEKPSATETESRTELTG